MCVSYLQGKIDFVVFIVLFLAFVGCLFILAMIYYTRLFDYFKEKRDFTNCKFSCLCSFYFLIKINDLINKGSFRDYG